MRSLLDPAVVVLLGVVASLVCIVAGLAALRRPKQTQRRLRRVSVDAVDDTATSDPTLLDGVPPEKSWLTNWGESLVRFLPSLEVERLRQLLAESGQERPLGALLVDKLIWSLIGVAIVLTAGIFLSSPGFLLVAVPVAFALLGMMPDLRLISAARQRRDAIGRELADAVDLLVVCVEAGLSFDAALAKVHERWHNALSIEFARVLTEQRLGRSKREALGSLVERTGVPDVQFFAEAIAQADELGVPVADVLATLAQELRVRRRQRAEEFARQAPVKMLIPTVMLIFPVTFIVILGPALPGLAKAFFGKP
ncbi:MAG: type II secretion system F family protein [Chloroflexi bacterium]|nr:type II secretion system F family protein [Chloroflexota bacterium]